MLQFVTSLQGHKNWVRSASFNSDGRLAVSGGDDSTVRIWDIRTKRCVRIYRDPGDRLNRVGFLLDGMGVASAGMYLLRWAASSSVPCDCGSLPMSVCVGSDGVIKVWDTRTDKLVQFYAAHSGPVRDMSFHPSGMATEGAADLT